VGIVEDAGGEAYGRLRPVRYLLTCLHCGASIIATERVSDPEVAAVELHLRADHADLLPAHRLDFAEALGHVRVKMQ